LIGRAALKSDHRPRTDCAQCPLRKLSLFRPFSDEELSFVQRFKVAELKAKPGATILQEGQDSPHLYTLLAGWAFRFKALPDDRRQILDFALPGNLLGMQGAVFEKIEHSVEALTEVTLCAFDRARLWELFNHHPSLAFDVAWLASRGEHFVDGNLLAVGRQTAEERVGHLFLQLYDRLAALGAVEGKKFACPASQRHIADALGLSLVHTNKTIQRMRRKGLIRWSPDSVEIGDEGKLRAMTGRREDDRRMRPLL
jgi:CRP/FNR family transcriptional regulator, anaerobic regulatory protein